MKLKETLSRIKDKISTTKKNTPEISQDQVKAPVEASRDQIYKPSFTVVWPENTENSLAEWKDKDEQRAVEFECVSPNGKKIQGSISYNASWEDGFSGDVNRGGYCTAMNIELHSGEMSLYKNNVKDIYPPLSYGIKEKSEGLLQKIEQEKDNPASVIAATVLKDFRDKYDKSQEPERGKERAEVQEEQEIKAALINQFLSNKVNG